MTNANNLELQLKLADRSLRKENDAHQLAWDIGNMNGRKLNAQHNYDLAMKLMEIGKFEQARVVFRRWLQELYTAHDFRMGMFKD